MNVILSLTFCWTLQVDLQLEMSYRQRNVNESMCLMQMSVR